MLLAIIILALLRVTVSTSSKYLQENLDRVPERFHRVPELLVRAAEWVLPAGNLLPPYPHRHVLLGQLLDRQDGRSLQSILRLGNTFF